LTLIDIDIDIVCGQYVCLLACSSVFVQHNSKRFQ